MSYKPRLKVRYDEEIHDKLQAELGLSNPMEVPTLEKIVLNMGLGEAIQDKKAIDEAIGTEQPGEDPRDHVIFTIDDDVCTRCALCVDRCPTGVIILGKVGDPPAEGDPHQRTNTHGYGYGMRLG